MLCIKHEDWKIGETASVPSGHIKSHIDGYVDICFHRKSKHHSNRAALFQPVFALAAWEAIHPRSQALSVAAAWPLLVQQSSFHSRSPFRCSGFTRLCTFKEVKRGNNTKAYSLTATPTEAEEETELRWEDDYRLPWVCATRSLVSHRRVTVQSNDW